MQTEIHVQTPSGVKALDYSSVLYGQLQLWQVLLNNDARWTAEASIMEIDPDPGECIEVINELMQGDEQLLQFVSETLNPM